MNTTEMIAFMRRIEKAVPPELNQLLSLEKKEPQTDGSIINHYRIFDGTSAPGYLWIQYQPSNKEVLSAEMDAHFNCLIGLNRSPIELRLLCNHVLQYLSEQN